MGSTKLGHIREAVYAALDEVNPMLPPGIRLEKEPGTRIAGPGALLDSVGFINLVVAAEVAIAARLGCEVAIIDLITSADQGRYATVESLAGLIDEHLAGTPS